MSHHWLFAIVREVPREQAERLAGMDHPARVEAADALCVLGETHEVRGPACGVCGIRFRDAPEECPGPRPRELGGPSGPRTLQNRQQRRQAVRAMVKGQGPPPAPWARHESRASELLLGLDQRESVHDRIKMRFDTDPLRVLLARRARTKWGRVRARARRLWKKRLGA